MLRKRIYFFLSKRHFELKLGKNILILSQAAAETKVLPHIMSFTSHDHSLVLVQQKRLVDSWKAIMRTKRFFFPFRSLFKKEELDVSVVQILISEYALPLRIISVFQKFFANDQIRFILCCPPEIIRTLRKENIPISYLSAFLWYPYTLKLTFENLFKNTKAILRLFRYYFKLRKYEKIKNPPTVFWLSLFSNFFRREGDVETLNIVEFIKEQRVPFLKKDTSVFLSKADFSGFIREPNTEIYIGGDPFLSPRQEYPSFIRTIIYSFIQVSLTALIPLYFFGRWWEILLAKEYVRLPEAKLWFETAKPQQIVHSLFSTKDLWILMRRNYGAEFWRVFYGTNLIPLEYQKERTGYTYPEYYVMLEDYFAVWDSEQALWLKDLGHSDNKVFICGPIIFGKYAPRPLPQKPDKKRLTVGIFDLVPASNAARLSMLGIGDYYFSFEIVSVFLENVIKACKRISTNTELRLIYNPKRVHQKMHDQRYWEFIKDIQGKNKEFEVLSPDMNPIDAVVQADCVIGFPYSSPVGIAEYYHIPSCYYDPTGKLEPHFQTLEHSPLFQSYPELVHWVEKTFSSHFQNKNLRLDHI